MKHVIAELEISLQIMQNNESINREMGNYAQANLERQNICELNKTLTLIKASSC